MAPQRSQSRWPIGEWLIDDWRLAWRFWSVRLIAIATFASAWPEAFLYLYALVPDDLQFLLPARTTVVVTCLVLAFVARILKQRTPDADETS